MKSFIQVALILGAWHEPASFSLIVNSFIHQGCIRMIVMQKMMHGIPEYRKTTHFSELKFSFLKSKK